jgi:hypothetical protein
VGLDLDFMTIICDLLDKFLQIKAIILMDKAIIQMDDI